METTEVDVAILGAGPCGLGAACELERLRSLGHARVPSYVVIDERSIPGGNASSITTPEGFTFDIGGHVLFPHEHYVNFPKLMSAVVENWHESIPKRGVWVDNEIIPYPIQRNIHRLKGWQFWRCMASLIAKAGQKTISDGAVPDTLDTHLSRKFGRQMADHVLLPLNRKMWAFDPRNMESSWTSHRSGSGTRNVPDADVWRLLRNFVTRRDDPGWNANTRVRYPLFGGCGAIWKSLADRLPRDRFLMGARVVAIDAPGRKLYLRSDLAVRYQNLISSIPLDELLTAANQPALLGFVSHLKYSAVRIVALGIEGAIPDQVKGIHSFHVPDPKISFWRITFPSNLSPGNVPDAKLFWSVLCECSEPTPNECENDITSRVEEELKAIGILKPGSKIVSRWATSLQHGYPIPFAGRDGLLGEIHPVLESYGILSRGRFGGWKYEVSNQDHAFMQGVEAVDRFLLGTPEATYCFPDLINS